ncbi:MAG: OmpA family protein, partial [Candidatus Rokuibacteriota bacterium]
GVTAELVDLRQAGGVLRLAVRFENSGAEEADPRSFLADRIVRVDVQSKEKHFPIKGAEGHFVAGPLQSRIGGGDVGLFIPPGGSTVLWAYFEPVAEGTVLNVELPYMFPFENVTVAEGAGSVFEAGRALSTPGGAVASLVSAKRADEVLTVRLRLASESGDDVDLPGAYFQFKEVFLFDPAGKRKYPLLKDSEGFFQAQPLAVRMDGGSFVYDWGKTTLVSLSFPAPPDDVRSADLFLPRFLPMEAISIEGLGGAAAGGIAASGKTVGLEAALEDLGAEVTETEIRIDLSADVLFDFDSAEVKQEAEPSLRKVATVLEGKPGAQVSIEGHTDGKGADDYNQTLSEQRAVSVKEWLVTNAQVDGADITTRGWGETKPVAPNAKTDGSDDPEGRAKNRRVEIVVRTGA